jgi:hypothetical protein
VSNLGITVFGVIALTFMMAMYALERRHVSFVLAFAVGCLLSSVYGFVSGAWPFGVVEFVWTGVAVSRYWRLRAERPTS